MKSIEYITRVKQNNEVPLVHNHQEGSMNRRPRIAILYHYMAPDDVVSAQHLSGLAEDLVSYGWEVEALPARRGCRDENKLYAAKERLEGVVYNRIWRPRFRQSSFFGRLANAAWMIMAWTAIALRSARTRPDVILLGTDPVFAALAAIPLKFIAPQIKLVHWCFDLHPEAAFATKLVCDVGLRAKLIKHAMRIAYRRFDVIADIGVCMRDLLRRYEHGAREVELTPWALEEPGTLEEPDEAVRFEMFGNAKLALLYSGNFGEAHTYEELLHLARSLRQEREIHFCIAVRGNQAAALKAAVTPQDTNISFAGFAPVHELAKRLGAADVHLVTLKANWAGIAVPSKFFGSLAIGRPVLYFGPKRSAIARWIEKFNIGWAVAGRNTKDVAEELIGLVQNPSSLHQMKVRSLVAYKECFSRASITARWEQELRALIAVKHGRN